MSYIENDVTIYVFEHFPFQVLEKEYLVALFQFARSCVAK